MIRNIIRIDDNLCDGCGLCASKCAEGALRIINGKARMVSETYCDGLGVCIGECPRGAITIEQREAQAFDEEAVRVNLDRASYIREAPSPCGCPGAAVRSFGPRAAALDDGQTPAESISELRQWPVQLMLVPEYAPYLQGADILVSADCVPYALPDFHSGYLKGRAVLVGCPKLDNIEFYNEKLADIFRVSTPASITVMRMEVPCCGGIARAVVRARDEATPDVPVDIITVGIGGTVTSERVPPLCEQRA